MGDPFSAIAGAVSIVDVALRSCNTLYDSICYLKAAPELTQDLQQSVQSIRSILQDLNALVARYRHSQVFTAQLHLPDAVNHEIVAIQTDLDLLSSLLPPTSSTRQKRTALKWLKNRRKVDEVILKLQRHQITLTLALQSPSQQMNADSHENILLLSEEIRQRHLNTKNELQADIGTLGIGLHDALRAFGQKAQESLTEQGHLKRLLERLLESQHLSLNENQATIMNEFRAVRSSLSDISISNNHIRTDTVVNVPTEAAVPRVVRAELRRVGKPTIEQCLNTSKANPDDQTRNMLEKLDETAEYFGQDLFETSCNRSSSASHSRPDAAIDEKCVQDDAGATGMLEPEQTGFENSTFPERPEGFLVRRTKHWKRSKVIRWPIGTLWVTVSSTHTTSNVSYAGEILQPQTAYRIQIQFQPAQSLVTLRGLMLSLETKQDQRGYYQVCPLLATFAIVPTDAKVMIFAQNNDVAGLQSLFERRLAAPTDRDEFGDSPLLMAARFGAPDACRFLLAMGADPLVKTESGQSLIEMAILGFALNLLHPMHTSNDSYTSMLEPLQSLADDLVENVQRYGYFLNTACLQQDFNPEQMKSLLDYIQTLKECRLVPQGGSILHTLFDDIMRNRPSIQRMEFALRLTLEIDGDFSALGCSSGLRPLSFIFFLQYQVRMESQDLFRESYRTMIGLATLLLRHGADPCELNLDGTSPIQFAHFSGLDIEFILALKLAGFNPLDVLVETIHRQCIFRNGRGESTTVDNEDIAPPSRKGLSRRRVVVRETDED